MKLRLPILVASCAAVLGAPPARAGEIFGGLYAHDVRIIAVGSPEHGPDFQLGWRGGPILRALGGPRPHLLVSLNADGGTHFAAAGISWQIGNPIYVRPGIGIAIHTGAGYPPPDRIWFNSRLLFEPEIGVGARLTPRLSVEASWVHLSHAQLAGHQNPGLDTVGLRFNYRFR
jgi:lipid A 3-O-deacylase